MHLAAASGHANVVEFLIKQGIDPDTKDRWGNTPLNDARSNGHMEVLRMLEKASLSIAETLCRAAFQNDVAEIKRLAEGGVDLNKGDYGSPACLV